MTNSAIVDPVDDDNPELTDADIARMRPAREVLSSAAYARLTGVSEVELTLPAATIRAFVEEGEDWRERMAEALTEAARKKRAA
ncbi:BrnA antitoxin family protein [Brevundimonas sp.]|uniref:BrnA antitoxin family protein n=1 Tax=Brevundimonas sp. TaxID=1871086 RepID=UPI003569D5F6